MRDPVMVDLVRHDIERSAWLRSRPVCEMCDEPIQDDHYFECEDCVFCPDCWDDYVRSNFLKFIDED